MSNTTDPTQITDPSQITLDQCGQLPTAVASAISPYGYIPSSTICIIFIVLFMISTAIHVGEAIRFRTYWLLPTAVLAGSGELIGWFGRLWSSQNVCTDGFLMQITTLIISPTPLLAANFIILGAIISELGPEFSRLTPKLYTRIFLTCDLIALLVQSAGGALASISKVQSEIDMGGNIMLGGVSFQLCAITVFTVVSSEFVYRYCKGKPLHAPAPVVAPTTLVLESSSVLSPADIEQKGIYSPVAHKDGQFAMSLQVPGGPPQVAAPRGFMSIPKKLRLALLGLSLSTALIFIRSVYRTLELADGFSGEIIRTEVYFNFFDGGMIVAAMFVLNVLHPGWLLPAGAGH